MEELQQQISEMFYQRAIGLYDYRSEELEEVQQAIERLHAAIQNLLPEKKQGLVMDLDEYYTDRDNIMQDQAYRRGLYDGIKLAKGFRAMGLDLRLVLKEFDENPVDKKQ